MRPALSLVVVLVAIASGACGRGAADSSSSAKELATEFCRAFFDAPAAETLVLDKITTDEEPTEAEAEAASESVKSRKDEARVKARAAAEADPTWEPLAKAMEEQYAFSVDDQQDLALAANTSMREVIRPRCQELLPEE